MRHLRAVVGLLLVGCRHPPDVARAPTVAVATRDARADGTSRRAAADAGDGRPDVAAATDAVARGEADAGAGIASAADGGACAVHVVAVLEAAVFTGPGVDSPARERVFQSLDPATASRWHGRDHALRHLRCVYAVTVNGLRYRYSHLADQALAVAEHLDPAVCHTADGRRAAADRIRAFTRGCVDLHAGEYWGYRLDPLAP